MISFVVWYILEVNRRYKWGLIYYLGNKQKATIYDIDNGTYRVEYIPPIPGIYTFVVTVNGHNLKMPEEKVYLFNGIYGNCIFHIIYF